MPHDDIAAAIVTAGACIYLFAAAKAADNVCADDFMAEAEAALHDLERLLRDY